MSETSFNRIVSLQQLNQAVAGSAALVWFSGPNCQLCTDLRPKVARLASAEFPRLQRWQVDCAQHPDIAAQHLVFSVPTLLIFFNGQETLRHCRNFSLQRLCQEIQRPYHLLFGADDG